MQQAWASPFDQRAADWDTPPRVALSRALGTVLQREMPLGPGMRVLDYGAGTGLASMAFASLGMQVTAVDTSAGMLEALGKKLAVLVPRPDITPVLLTPGSALPAGPFDLVHLSMVLHHIEDAGRLIADLARRLAPGGQLAIFDLAPDEGLFHDNNAGVFHDGFEPDRLRQWFAEAGLDNIRITEAHRMTRNRTTADGSVHTLEFPILLAMGARATP